MRTLKIHYEQLAEYAIAIPIWPVEYWEEWHIWYMNGMDNKGSIRISEIHWVDVGDALFEYRGMKFPSPVEGAVVGEYHDRGDRCLLVRPPRGKYNDFGHSFRIGHTYRELFDYLMSHVKSAESGFFYKLKQRNVLSMIDKKEKFYSWDDFLKKIDELIHIEAFRIPAFEMPK